MKFYNKIIRKKQPDYFELTLQVVYIWLSFTKLNPVMKKYLLLGAVLLSITASFAFKPVDEHFKGYINDAICGASKNETNMGPDRVACAKKCIKGGSAAVLVVGDKVYQIANQKAVLKYAGENVLVDGALTADTIQVTKIVEDK